MKRKKIVKIVSLVILIIGIILIGFGISFSRKKTNAKEEKGLEKTYLDITNNEVIDSYNKVNFTDINRCIDITNFEEKNISNKKISSSLAFDIYTMNRSRMENNTFNDFTLNEIKNNIKNFLGEEYNFDITKVDKSCYFDQYDEKSDIIYLKENTCNCNRKVYTKLYNAVQYDNILELYEYRLYEENGLYYKNEGTDVSLDVVLDSNNVIDDIIENYEKGKNYKYTFKFKNDNYYLEKIERIFQ